MVLAHEAAKSNCLNRVISHDREEKGWENFVWNLDDKIIMLMTVLISIQYAAATKAFSIEFWILLEEIYPYRVETSRGSWEF